MSNSKIIETIRKLTKLANDSAATPGEIEAALGRASHLMSKHGITDAEVEAIVDDEGNASVNIDQSHIKRREMHRASNLARWDWALLEACARAVDCRTYKAPTGYGNGARLYAYGLETDLAVCAELFAFARSALRKAVRRYCKEQREVYGRHWVQSNTVEGRSFKDGFCLGLRKAADAAKGEQSKSLEPAQVTMNGCTALVPVSGIVEAKRTALQIWHNSRKWGKSRSRSVQRDGESYGAGYEKGKATSLGRNSIQG